MNYRLAYALGFHPWEDMADHAPFADALLALVADEENASGPPHGRALDVGTGSAVWAVRLAERGWQVTGVELVEKALERARERVADADLEVELIQGDVTALGSSGVGSGFRLIVDTGTFHGLDEPGRAAMGREVSEIAAEDATVLLDCFEPRWRGPLPRGASRAEVESAFAGWRIVDERIADSDPDAIARLARFNERFYRLRRA